MGKHWKMTLMLKVMMENISLIPSLARLDLVDYWLMYLCLIQICTSTCCMEMVGGCLIISIPIMNSRIHYLFTTSHLQHLTTAMEDTVTHHMASKLDMEGRMEVVMEDMAAL